MKGIKIIALTMASASVLGAASSAMAVPSVPSGWYLEGNIGTARTSSTGGGVSGGKVSNSGIAWNINAGYKFIPYFAAEIGGTYYGKATSKIAGTKVSNITYYSYDLAAKAILPAGDSGFDFFAKLGIAGVRSNVKSANSGINVSTGNSTSSGAFYGLGADYFFMPTVSGVVQWQRAKGNSKTGIQDLYSVGIAYIIT